MKISLKPSDAIQGGLVQDIDVRITKCRAVVYDYNGHAKPTLAVHVQMEPLEGGEPLNEYYSAGVLERFCPSETSGGDPLTNLGEEGAFITLAEGSTATALSSQSNFATFLKELVSANFPEDKIEDNVSILEGLEGHVNRKSQPARAGMADAPQGDAKAKVRTILVFTKILKFPWDKKAGAAKPATKTAAVGGPVQDANGVALGQLAVIVAKSGGSVTPADAKKQAFAALLSPAFKVTVSPALRKEACDLIVNTDWLEALGGDFAFDGTDIVAA